MSPMMPHGVRNAPGAWDNQSAYQMGGVEQTPLPQNGFLAKGTVRGPAIGGRKRCTLDQRPYGRPTPMMNGLQRRFLFVVAIFQRLSAPICITINSSRYFVGSMYCICFESCAQHEWVGSLVLTSPALCTCLFPVFDSIGPNASRRKKRAGQWGQAARTPKEKRGAGSISAERIPRQRYVWTAMVVFPCSRNDPPRFAAHNLLIVGLQGRFVFCISYE